MAEISDRYGMIYQNLIDSGLDEISANKYAAQLINGDIPSAVRQLKAHRRQMLDEIHINQKRIDCLDFLVYSLEKESGRKLP